jgi:hypothetical protein
MRVAVIGGRLLPMVRVPLQPIDTAVVARRLLPLRLPPRVLGARAREIAAGNLTDPTAAADGPAFADWLAAR